MNGVRKVTEDLYWVGVNDKRIELFENIHPIPEGVSYNAYLLLDEKTVLFDTVDWSGCRVFLENIAAVLDGRKLDYLVVNHMEPDHAASLEEIRNVKLSVTKKHLCLCVSLVLMWTAGKIPSKRAIQDASASIQ